VALLFYLYCSVFRLAKYNITPKQNLKLYFSGLPTTVGGGLLASFILIYRRYTQSPPPVLFFLMVLILAVLMVSRVKYANLDYLKDLLKKKTFTSLIVFIFIISWVFVFYYATGVFLPEISIFLLFLAYLVFSPFILRKTV
jgi:phosphatidylserine synthase